MRSSRGRRSRAALTCCRLNTAKGSTLRSRPKMAGRLVIDKVTHPRAAVTQIPSTDESSDVFQPGSSSGGLRERDTRSDVDPESILLLPDELEVNASVAVQKSCNVGRLERVHCVGLPSVLPRPYCSVVTVGFHRYEPESTQGLLPGDAVYLRSKPSSRTALMGEQPNPWDRLQPQDATSRHRGAKPFRRCGLLGRISLLSPEYLLSVEQRRFHTQSLDHYGLLSHLLDL